MRSATPECRLDGGLHALRRRRLVFQYQNEIHQIPHAAVRRLAWTRVSVKLLGPMLFDGERRHHNGRNAGETEPVFALDAFERLEDFVSDAEVNVEPDERSTVEMGVNGKSRAALGSLIQFGHRLAHDERKEVGQRDGRCELKPLSQRRLVLDVSASTPDGQVEILRRPRHVESHLERVTAFEDPAVANGLGRVEHACEEPIERDLPAETMQINSIATRPFIEPRLECGSKRAGGGVLALSCHQVPASGFCRFVVVPEC